MRSPFVVASAFGVVVAGEPNWVDCKLVPGETYRLRALVEGTASTADNAALVRLETKTRDSKGWDGLRTSASIGPHAYLRTGDGTHCTDRIFRVAGPTSRLGIMAWGDRGETVLKTLTVERANGLGRPTDFFMSFDVEAGANSAAGEPIDSLVWGKIGGGEYGLRRICDVLDEHRVRGNFLIDFATCIYEGEDATRRIADFLVERGHEIHMHLHPGSLPKLWGVRVNRGASIHLDSNSYETSRRLLEFTISKYERFVGRVPRLFRSGAYRMNANLVLAAGALGIEALSNVHSNKIRDPGVGGDAALDREPFVWENGVVEIPVDMSSPEVGSFENYLRKYDSATKRKSTERTFNVVMHSWSLMRRNDAGIRDAFAPEYEHRLHQICEHAVRNGKTFGYGEYLDQHISRPVLRLSRIPSANPEPPVYVASGDIVSCNVCDLVFARSRMELDFCPGCGLGSNRRQLMHVLENFGNVFDGRAVLADRLTMAERRAFLFGASRVVDLGTVVASDFPDEALLDRFRAVKGRSFDCVVGLDILRHSVDAAPVVAEAARVLKSNGVFVTTHPQRPLGDEPNEAYDAMAALSQRFRVSLIPGFDPVEKKYSSVILAYRS